MKEAIQYIKNPLIQLLTDYLLNPVIFGLYGYMIFLAIIFALNSIASLMSSSPFNLTILEDLFFSSTGFILFFFIKMLENFKYTGEHKF